MALESTNLYRLPYFNLAGGLSVEFGAWLPRGSKAIYVRSTGVQSQDDQNLARKILPTLAAGLAECRSGMGDTVFLLPGHSETFTDNTVLTNLVAGSRVIGLGDPEQDDAPTLRLTNTAAQMAVSVNNCLFANLRLRLEGANGITKAINITGAGTTFANNFIQVASGASNKATIAMEVGSGATGCRIINNHFVGTETHNVTDCIKVVGATVPSDLFIYGNRMIASATAGNGLIHVTVAALRMQISNNVLYNTHTSSTATIALDNVAMDGFITDNYSAVKADGTASATGIVVAGASVLCVFAQNFTVDEKAKSGVLSPPVVAT